MIRTAAIVLVGCLALAFAPRVAPNAEGLKKDAPSVGKVKLALNWKPEPEFGGFYAAQVGGDFKAANLDVDILPGGSGTPTIQMVDNGKVEYGIVSADELVSMRAKGSDVVAIFATFQTCPQALMTYADRPVKDLKELVEGPGTVAWQAGLPFVQHLKKTYNVKQLTEVPYTGGLPFLKSKDFAQQCFVFSEPLVALQKGTKVKTFLIADSGYNPYTVVLVTKGAYMREHTKEVAAVAGAVRLGWQAYLQDPRPANDAMRRLNPALDADLFTAGAQAQAPLIAPAGTDPVSIGNMSTERWKALIDQLVACKVIAAPIDPGRCYINR